eukprot:scaffold46528_cov72-Cyclotella_meneghiniana.AAC.1
MRTGNWNLGSTTIKREYIHQEIQDIGYDDERQLTSSSDLQCGCFDRSLLVQLKILLTVHCTDERITQEHLEDFNRHRKIGNDAIQTQAFSTMQVHVHQSQRKMETKQTILAIYNYATDNSYEIATEEQRSMGDLTAYKESTAYRIMFLLKAVADKKYCRDKTVQQLMSSIHPFDLVPIACTGVAWTKKFPNEQAHLYSSLDAAIGLPAGSLQTTMKLHHQQSGARLPICLGSSNATTIFDLPEDSGIVCSTDYDDMRILGFKVRYGRLCKGGGINMSQERRQDYDTVINDVAILTGCKDANDKRWVYMEKYDWYTCSFENAALKAGEEYDGEYTGRTCILCPTTRPLSLSYM